MKTFSLLQALKLFIDKGLHRIELPYANDFMHRKFSGMADTNIQIIDEVYYLLVLQTTFYNTNFTNRFY